MTQYLIESAGAEARIWKTQYGFRSGRGTSEALFVARRLMDDVWAQKDGSLVFLALDWAKAFDSVSPSALLTALGRFGVPAEFVDAVGAIYSVCCFAVNDPGAVCVCVCVVRPGGSTFPSSPYVGDDGEVAQEWAASAPLANWESLLGNLSSLIMAKDSPVGCTSNHNDRGVYRRQPIKATCHRNNMSAIHGQSTPLL